MAPKLSRVQSIAFLKEDSRSNIELKLIVVDLWDNLYSLLLQSFLIGVKRLKNKRLIRFVN